ncbi:GD15353 [Drosophila simulans]|uniref:GD15353 n=1 Tax=Drosophila simulans TaxID=7240 RepID=B4NS54_DROSI|nr:GD15353 [Drosophila simulans]
MVAGCPSARCVQETSSGRWALGRRAHPVRNQLLHKDLKRNSFRAVSATSKDFVMNPLFESEPLGGKTALRPETEDQGDSGVDSCLNGFSGADAKYSNNSLLF